MSRPTSRARGPPWSRDEVILTLALYRQIHRVPEEYEPHVKEIADLIERTPDAVVYKIANLRFLDTRGRRGFRNIGAMDKLVTREFRGKDTELRAEAERIRQELRATPDNEVKEEESVGRGQGFSASSEDRSKIEGIAMRVAIAHFQKEGYTVEDVHMRKPYDLKCSKGREELFVEVKGTIGSGDKLLLTAGEVKFAQNHERDMALFLVHSIDPASTRSVNGTEVMIRPWKTEAGNLRPISYIYTL